MNMFTKTMVALVTLTCMATSVRSKECLSSDVEVRKEHPGVWPSWSKHVSGHKGQKCWFGVDGKSDGRHVAKTEKVEKIVRPRRDPRKPEIVVASNEDEKSYMAGVIVNREWVAELLRPSRIFDQVFNDVQKWSWDGKQSRENRDRFDIELDIRIFH